MSFLSELMKQKNKLKGTETVVTNVDGQRFIEKGGKVENLDRTYGFVVDTKPDNIPVLIIDHLYIGSQDCAVSSVLESCDIKCVLSLGIDIQVDVEHKFVSCLDLPETDIKPVLNECLPFVFKAVESRNNVLIHCNAGVSRTSMVAIAFLMHYKCMTYEDAYNLVKEKRPAIQPNAGFKQQLIKFRPGELI